MRTAAEKLNNVEEKSTKEHLTLFLKAVPFEKPEFRPPEKDHGGIFGKTKRFLVGESDTENDRYARKCEKAKEYFEKSTRKRREEYNDDLMQNMKKEWDFQDLAQTNAKQELEAARSAYHESVKALGDSKDQLNLRKRERQNTNLEIITTHDNLRALKSENMDLGMILRIIQQSMNSLMKMKQYVDGLRNFFTQILDSVKTGMSRPLSEFSTSVRPEIGKYLEAENTETVNRLEFTEKGERLLIEAALRLHGKMETMTDVADIYVRVSTKYIKPAMNMMEEIAFADESAYDTKMLEFKKWCIDSAEEIDTLAIDETENLANNSISGVSTVAKYILGIEASNAGV
ncbi:hypothetical protein TWF788_009735 [Orbilia oligospora]|uniref:Uncharacterized protein n=1 Tax=Orbilia oligospora TaxID=2813651 RepID=A0A7C8Q207_ORBOL|nr:hypothetical protein TWF788_009735 [Orbilia oligospora]